ncbi:Histone deacetylase domain family protein [Babesia bovis T2Bo]|uniref:Histone deacetylase domain family protein n=1 Tax=Babesia bovis T2Bo TaxID=484906 RepID=UPI001D5126C2|nr:Histone deacetylase domain family protein [Babesia bovis T2Bo]EDO05777.2 Histone deacetylase domain family protein [Babesia bovis T2Bo]
MDIDHFVNSILSFDGATDPVSVFDSEVLNVTTQKRKTTAIHNCILKRDYSGLKRILASKKRECINDCDHYGRTPFHIALQLADPKALYLLLYYPLLHSSKLFAVQNLDSILEQSMAGQSQLTSIDVIYDCNIEDTEICSGVQCYASSGNHQSDMASNDFEANEYDIFVSTGNSTTAETTSEAECLKTKKRLRSYNLAPYLLRHWEKHPKSYLQSAVGVTNETYIHGCAIKEVEAFYDEHFRYLIGKSHQFEKVVRNYSSKYAKLYANHPINHSHVVKLLTSLQNNLYTKVNILKGFGKSCRPISITTCIGNKADETCMSGLQSSSITEEDKQMPNSVEHIHEVDVPNITPTDNSERRASFRKLWADLDRKNALHIPISTCDVEATFDKTPPIHLLFSNLYIEGYRANIYKCFRILSEYFNAFSVVEGSTHYQVNAAEHDGISIRLGTSQGSNDSVCSIVNSSPISPVIPDLPVDNGSTTHSSTLCPDSHKSEHNACHLSKQPCDNSTLKRPKKNVFEYSTPDSFVVGRNMNVENDCSTNRQHQAMDVMTCIDQSGNSLSDRTETTVTSFTGSNETHVDECANIPKYQPNCDVDDRTLSDKNVFATNANRLNPSYTITKTVCSDVETMGNSTKLRGIGAFGDVKGLPSKNKVHSSSEDISTNSSDPSICQFDQKVQLLSDTIVASSKWLKPTIHWNRFINSRDYTRSNILHKVCQIKNAELIRWILECGCNPLVVNEAGDLPLHLAVETKDPICTLTIFHATMSGLFYHMLGSSDSNQQHMDDGVQPHVDNSAYEKYMSALRLNRDKIVADLSVVGHATMPSLGAADSLSFIEEMVFLLEQLTYRAIKVSAWDVLVAMYTYNEVLSAHLMTNPHYMHRFINMSVHVGNSTQFMTTMNYMTTRVLHVDPADVYRSIKYLDEIRNEICCSNEALNQNIFNISTAMDKDLKSRLDCLNETLASDCNSKYRGKVKSSRHSVCIPHREGTKQLKWDKVEETCESLQGSRFYKSASVEHPNKQTWIITHPTCLHHLALPEPTDAPNRRHRLIMSFPENPTRLEVIVSNENAILRSDTLENVKILRSPPPATLADVLRVHHWSYIESLLQKVQTAQSKWEQNPYWPVLADQDTPTTPHSWNSALYAAGSVIAAVDAVCKGQCRNVFCAVRPPGHHLGTWGAAQSKGFEDEDFAAGSQGFCLINNVAVGAAYAKYMYAKEGIRRIAIVDFDIHHGNGTHQIVSNIGPRTFKTIAHHSADDPNTRILVNRLPAWFGWRDTHDKEEVFFSSIHAYDGVFYPGTGETCSRYEPSEPRIINVGIPQGTTSENFRILFETRILPYLLHFDPDLIFISAGFDGHYRDSVSSGFVSYKEKDFYWATERLVAVANTVCNGRVISVLEGGYNTRLDTLSPFAKSVFEHVKALSNTSDDYKYPFIHPYGTTDLLLVNLILRNHHLFADSLSRNVSDGGGVSVPIQSILKMYQTVETLLRRVYRIEGFGCFNRPTSTSSMSMTKLSAKAISNIGNGYFGLYTKHFDSMFAIDYNGNKGRPLPPANESTISTHNIMKFDQLLLEVYDNEALEVSPDQNSSLTDLEYAAIKLQNNDEAKEILMSDEWVLKIKAESLDRYITIAALLLSYFRRFSSEVDWRCNVHC